jgi:hypothetical protein
MSFLGPGRQARRWMCVTSRGRIADAEKIPARLQMNPEFAAKVYEMIAPGTTVIITDQPVVRSRQRGHPRKVRVVPHCVAVQMIAAPLPQIAILQNFNIDLLKELKPAKGRQWWGNVTIADGSAKSVLPGVTGQARASERGPAG